MLSASPSAPSSGACAFLEHLVGIEGLELDLLVLHDGDVLAALLALGLVLGARHVEHDLHGHLGVERNARFVQPERLDRPLENHLTAVDGEAARRHHLGDVAGGDRAVELAGVAGRADRDEGLAVELLGDRLGLLLQFEIVGLELSALGFELGAVLLGGPQRLLLRQQKVASIPILHVDDVAHLAEPADALKQNDLHWGNSSSFRVL